MTGLPDLRRRILAELRHGPLDLITLADDIGAPAFEVRAELHKLRRDRIVRSRMAPDRHLWQLTLQGAQIAWQQSQLPLL